MYGNVMYVCLYGDVCEEMGCGVRGVVVWEYGVCLSLQWDEVCS